MSGNGFYVASHIWSTRIDFARMVNVTYSNVMARFCSVYTDGIVDYTGFNLETTLHKVTSLSADSTNTQYPSAKAVYDAIQAAKPDIVTPTAESTDTQAASAKAVWDMLGGGSSGTDISLGVTGASVGDIIKVKAVDDSGKPTEWEAATAKLANPNALTFTGAVTGSYDGSAPLSVEIPSGGGGRTLELIADVTTAEETTMISITQDSDGNPFSIKSWAAYIYIPAHERDTAKPFYARGTSYGGGMTFNNMLITSNKEIGFFLYPIANYDAQDALDIDHPLKAQYISSSGGNSADTTVGFRTNISIFQVYTNNTEVLFPAGVRVRLWGVRT